MPQGVIDISVIGDKALLRKFAKLETKEGRKIVSTALRNSAKRLKPLVAAATPVHSGTLKAAMGRVKVRSASKSRNELRFGLQMPTREELGIPPWPEATGYYPYAIEYGTRDGRIPPKRFIRGTVDAHRDEEIDKIGKEIGAALERKARK